MIIRQADEKDISEIVRLATELAIFENKKPEEISLTYDKIKSHGFGERPFFHVIVAEQDDRLTAFALYFFSYSAYVGAPVLYVEDLFVEEKYRGQGIGTALFSKLAKTAIENECCRMEWHAYVWNDKAIRFYENLNAFCKDDLRQFRLTDDGLMALSTIA